MTQKRPLSEQGMDDAALVISATAKANGRTAADLMETVHRKLGVPSRFS